MNSDFGCHFCKCFLVYRVPQSLFSDHVCHHLQDKLVCGLLKPLVLYNAVYIYHNVMVNIFKIFFFPLQSNPMWWSQLYPRILLRKKNTQCLRFCSEKNTQCLSASQMSNVNGWSELGSSNPRISDSFVPWGREPRIWIFDKFLDCIHGAGLGNLLWKLLSGGLGYCGTC